MQTSLVKVIINVVVQHEENEDPINLVNEANYSIDLDQGDSKTQVVNTEVVDVGNLGRCHPTEFFLYED